MLGHLWQVPRSLTTHIIRHRKQVTSTRLTAQLRTCNKRGGRLTREVESE